MEGPKQVVGLVAATQQTVSPVRVVDAFPQKIAFRLEALFARRKPEPAKIAQ